jgi:hydrogenase/urease accessory protein HupE
VASEFVPRHQVSKALLLDGAVRQTNWTVFKNYVVIGFEHIVPDGLDHILFVVGLFLLSPRFKDLLTQITCFTLAHSVSLALGMLGLVNLSPAIVEPLIAASIVFVAVENIFRSGLSRWRPLLVFGFGLLHGLGFAGVLREVGLEPGHFITGLLAFNAGVELGQLTVVVICFALVGVWFRAKSWYRAGITVPASVLVAAVGAYWFVERTL